MYNIPFQIIDWEKIERTEHKGETGISFWQTVEIDGLRMRLIEYSEDYIGDHWCHKGHMVYCLEGVLTFEFEDGERFKLSKGMTYIVSDEFTSHRSVSYNGVKILIIDGDFLKSPKNNKKVKH